MTDLFKGLVEASYHQEIFDALQGEITHNYGEYDLEHRADVVQEVLEASLDQIQVIKAFNLNQEDDEVWFDLIVSCHIDVGDYFSGETISESVCQWFQLSCSAVLQNATLNDFSVNWIAAYNK